MAARFDLIPAIDLRDGRAVRLVQGDFERQTDYGDPVEAARRFVGDGAAWLHVVDLDGARSGEPAQAAAIANIVAGVGDRARVEVAGGLRSAETVAVALSSGASRVVVGTALLRSPALAAELVAAHGPERIVAAIDVRDGMALGEGWRDGAPGIDAPAAIVTLAQQGITIFAVTAIDRDGLLGGPDVDLLGRAVALGAGEIIASGGIGSLEDVLAVRRLGCRAAIVGRALYDCRFTVRSALDAISA